ncbi:GNAT family N-acetyltransferase [Tabrizicola sp. BL-A-41-H6]|uniref:GNAT family N-acetyltransferase n=1 Tax=Tabrizicola sp. BL-A-41-H6 TaxID=3421107 RepID=UPI003D664C73
MAEEMAALHALCFTTPKPWSAAEFASMLADPFVFALTEAEGFLLGRAAAGEAEVLTLAVAPQARRRGMGAKLMARFLYQARLRGADTAFLEVAAGNAAALALYRAHGFVDAGRRRGYYRHPDGRAEDALVLSRSLGKPAPPAAT